MKAAVVAEPVGKLGKMFPRNEKMKPERLSVEM